MLKLKVVAPVMIFVKYTPTEQSTVLPLNALAALQKLLVAVIESAMLDTHVIKAFSSMMMDDHHPKKASALAEKVLGSDRCGAAGGEERFGVVMWPCL